MKQPIYVQVQGPALKPAEASAYAFTVEVRRVAGGREMRISLECVVGGPGGPKRIHLTATPRNALALVVELAEALAADAALTVEETTGDWSLLGRLRVAADALLGEQASLALRAARAKAARPPGDDE